MATSETGLFVLAFLFGLLAPFCSPDGLHSTNKKVLMYYTFKHIYFVLLDASFLEFIRKYDEGLRHLECKEFRFFEISTL